MSDMDPEMAAARRRMAELAGGVERGSLPLPEQRRRVEADRAWWEEGAPEPARRFTLEVPFRGGSVTVHGMVPVAAGGRPLVYVHGGGWRVGSSRADDGFLRRVAAAAGAPILSIDYSLSPERRFPRALDEVDAAIDAILDAQPVPMERWTLGGCSAGGNLALAAALQRRDRGAALPDGLLLFYGVFGSDLDTPSYRQFGDGSYGLSRANMESYWTDYADPEQRRHPLAAPLLADLAGLPPAFLGVAELDPLRDDSLAMAERMRAAGVPVTLERYPGMCHGFVHLARTVRQAERAVADAGRFLRG